MAGPALYKGKVGSTGVSTDPHAHFALTKDGKPIPLSIARKDIGQHLQFRLPGREDWQSVYSPENQGFSLNPATQITSPMGKRTAPAPGASTDHLGEDYAFPEGTSLRFLGSGSISTHAGLGSAGNVSALRTGPYELQTFHLSELPEVATTRGQTAPEAPILPTPDQNTDTLMESLFGKQESLKDVLTASLLQQALARKQETAVANPYKSLNSTLQQTMELFA
jgi:murein DD-endopeptidase MepM/ murein hydrolase activator NlpD